MLSACAEHVSQPALLALWLVREGEIERETSTGVERPASYQVAESG
jgi:hypothetical protein